MMENRQLNWDGCTNVRDLGGLSADNGRNTRWGAWVRSDDPFKRTTKGVESYLLEAGPSLSDLGAAHARLFEPIHQDS